MPESPQMLTAEIDARELVDQEQGEEEERGRLNINTEDQGDPHDTIEGRGDIAYYMQGGLPNPDNYIQGMVIEPPTVEQPTGWWPYEAHCREIHDLQDRPQGMEERLGVKEGLPKDYRESTSSLRAIAP